MASSESVGWAMGVVAAAVLSATVGSAIGVVVSGGSSEAVG
jgi:hypothetical protein